MSILLGYGHLPIPACQVQGRKVFLSIECIEHLMDFRNRESVLDRRIIQLPIVHAEPPTPVLLCLQDNWGTIGAFGRSDHPFSSMLLTSSLMIGILAGEVRFGCTFIGPVSPVSIRCVTKLVRPNSASV